mmetsp:Transcript_113759/g.321714  ORF Transcript_113759/g.321714 Transcript_113759/m.321714 type:complete len:204 (+) Transcript_113759:463-1074(+)
MDHNRLDVGEEPIHHVYAGRADEIPFQQADVPLGASAPVGRFAAMFLQGDVRQVRPEVVHVRFVGCVPGHRESAEAAAMHVHSEGLIAGNQDVQPDVKLFASDQQWPLDVLLAYVQLRSLLGVVVVLLFLAVFAGVRCPVRRWPPLLNLRQLVHEENPRTLRPAHRFHDPRRARMLLELLDEHAILLRHDEGDGAHVVLLRLV